MVELPKQQRWWPTPPHRRSIPRRSRNSCPVLGYRQGWLEALAGGSCPVRRNRAESCLKWSGYCQNLPLELWWWAWRWPGGWGSPVSCFPTIPGTQTQAGWGDRTRQKSLHCVCVSRGNAGLLHSQLWPHGDTPVSPSASQSLEKVGGARNGEGQAPEPAQVPLTPGQRHTEGHDQEWVAQAGWGRDACSSQGQNALSTARTLNILEREWRDVQSWL